MFKIIDIFHSSFGCVLRVEGDSAINYFPKCGDKCIIEDDEVEIIGVIFESFELNLFDIVVDKVVSKFNIGNESKTIEKQ